MSRGPIEPTPPTDRPAPPACHGASKRSRYAKNEAKSHIPQPLGHDAGRNYGCVCDDREDELLDAAVTAAALVARADGRVEPVERGEMLDFLDRNGFLSVFTRADVLDPFEARVRQLGEGSCATSVVDSLRPLAGRSPAHLVIALGERVAAADNHFHSRESQVLQLIRLVLSTRFGSPGSSDA
jgi:tellurite resistance protein